MKYKKIFLITLLLLSILTISSVSATENNSTNELISFENNISTNIVGSENSPDNIQINENSSINNRVLKSSLETNSSLSASVENNDSLLKSEIVTYNAHDAYEYGAVKTYLDIDKNLKVEHKSNSYFGIYLFTCKGSYDVEYEKIMLKIWTGKKAKQYTLYTGEGGYAQFNTKKLKVGTHKVKVIFKGSKYDYFGCKAYSKIIVKKSINKKTSAKKTNTKKKSKYKTVKIKIKSPNSYFATKKLKTGDKLQTVYSKGGQYSKGVYAEVLDYDYPIHTKIKKVKFFFKNKYSGKIKIKTVKKVKNSKYSSTAKTKLISGYTPYKAKVWYTKR